MPARRQRGLFLAQTAVQRRRQGDPRVILCQSCGRPGGRLGGTLVKRDGYYYHATCTKGVA